MHETQLARQILEVALAELARAEGTRVLRVRGWVAETEALSPESLAFHFGAHAAGTPAEGATLEFECRHVRARCAGCGCSYRPDHHLLLCPRCGSTEATLLDRTGMGVEEIDLR